MLHVRIDVSLKFMFFSASIFALTFYGHFMGNGSQHGSIPCSIFFAGNRFVEIVDFSMTLFGDPIRNLRRICIF